MNTFSTEQGGTRRTTTTTTPTIGHDLRCCLFLLLSVAAFASAGFAGYELFLNMNTLTILFLIGMIGLFVGSAIVFVHHCTRLC
uniref:IncA protein n=1 Tax=Globodera pallida TaxID=36090 RepID=A0A183BX80_GLOPA